MLEGQCRLGQHIVGKRVAAQLLQLARTCLDQRIVRRRKRQLVDHHQLQRIPRNVHPLPEGTGRHQHAAASVHRTGAKALHQRMLGALPLHQHIHGLQQPKARPQLAPDLLQRAQRGGQHQGAPSQGCGAVPGQPGHGIAVLRDTGQRKAFRHIQRRLVGVIEWTVHPQHLGAVQPTGLGEPAQVIPQAQGGRGEDPGRVGRHSVWCRRCDRRRNRRCGRRPLRLRGRYRRQHGIAVRLRRFRSLHRRGPILVCSRCSHLIHLRRPGATGCQVRVAEGPHLQRRMAGHQLLAHQAGNAQRRLRQPQVLAAHVQPAHGIVRSRPHKMRQPLQQQLAALLQVYQGGRHLQHPGQRLHHGAQGLSQVHRGRAPLGGIQGVRGQLLPAQARLCAAVRAGNQAPVAHGLLHARGQYQPVRHAPGMVAGILHHITGIGQQLVAAEHQAGKLDPGFVQLVGFVDHHHPRLGQQLRHAGLAHLHVGKKQVVVDHGHIGLQRLLARAVDMAGLPVRAFAAHAVVARGRHQRNHLRILGQIGQLGHVAAARGARPVLHPRHGTQHLGIQRLLAQAHLQQALLAQIAAAPLEPCHAQRQPQALHQPGQIAREQLVLQRLGGRGHHHPLAAEQRRHQVGIGFAHARAGFHHQHAAIDNGLGHGLGHGSLSGAGVKMRLRPGQCPIGRKHGAHGIHQGGRHARALQRKKSPALCLSDLAMYPGRSPCPP